MKKVSKLLALLACVAMITGCGSGEQKNADEPKPQASTAPVAAPEEPAEEMDNDGHDDPVDLGTQTSGDYTVGVIAYGGIEAGHNGDIDVDVDGGSPKAVRAWVGLEDAVGTPKALGESEGGGHYHVHVDVSDELPDGAQFWLEIEEESGEVVLLAFDF